MSLRAVGRHSGRSHTTIAQFLKKTKANGAVYHAGTGDRQTTARADRRLFKMVPGNPTLPATRLRLKTGERGLRQHSELRYDSKSDLKARASLKEDAQTLQTDICSCSTQRTVGNATSLLEATTLEASHLHGRKSLSPVPH